jgi:hypothetical protein
VTAVERVCLRMCVCGRLVANRAFGVFAIAALFRWWVLRQATTPRVWLAQMESSVDRCAKVSACTSRSTVTLRSLMNFN